MKESISQIRTAIGRLTPTVISKQLRKDRAMKNRAMRKIELDRLPLNQVAKLYMELSTKKTGSIQSPPVGVQTTQIVEMILDLESSDFAEG